jgi:anti-sigma B factor antagonist
VTKRLSGRGPSYFGAAIRQESDAAPGYPRALSRCGRTAPEVTEYDGPVATKLSINRSDDAQGVVIVLSGELDLASAPGLERSLSKILAEANGRVLLDLNQLTFVDSAGVTVLIRAKHEAEAIGRPLVLRRPTAQVHRVFSVVGLADWLSDESA